MFTSNDLHFVTTKKSGRADLGLTSAHSGAECVIEILVILHNPPLNPTFLHTNVFGKKIEVNEVRPRRSRRGLVNLALLG